MQTGVGEAGWPLVGRADELELLRHLRSAKPPTSAVVVGPSGVGKSTLSGAAAAEAAEAGWATLAIRGSLGFGEVPLGPFRTVLPVRASSDLTEMTVSVQQELLGLQKGRGLLVLADDCQDLDEPSVGVLHQLVATRSITAIMTVRSGTALSPALTSLWKDGLAERIELQNLSQAETVEMLTARLGGPLQDSSGARLWHLTEGNPLYLREIVLAGLESGALEDVGGEWRWHGEWATESRLRELVAARIGRLPPDAISAMELVALAGSLPLSMVAGLTSERAVEELEDQSLVTIEGSAQRLEVSIAHPLHAEVLRYSTPALRRRAMWHNLVEALKAEGVERDADQVRLACWSLEAGVDVDKVTLARGADASLFGIAHAISGRLHEIFPENVDDPSPGDALPVRQDIALALRLAEAAFERTGAVADGVELASALSWAGQIERAEGVLAEVAQRAEEVDDRVRLALALAWIRFWGQHDVDAARAGLVAALEADGQRCAPRLRADLLEQLAGIAVQTGHPAEALALAEESAAAQGVALHESIAAPPAAGALSYLGRGAEAIDLVDRAVPVAHGEGRMMAVATLLFSKAGGLARSGQLEQARELAEWLRDVALANDMLESVANFGVLLGEILLRLGRPASAGRIFRDSSGLLADYDVFGYRPWALWGLARARVMAGEELSAYAAVEEASRLQDIARHFDWSRYMAEMELHSLAGR
jgi:hypothetical protein